MGKMLGWAGNFSELLKLQAKCDVLLEEHLRNPVGCVTYLSHQPQTALISACSKKQSNIMTEAKLLKFYSVADKRKDQLCSSLWCRIS